VMLCKTRYMNDVEVSHRKEIVQVKFVASARHRYTTDWLRFTGHIKQQCIPHVPLQCPNADSWKGKGSNNLDKTMEAKLTP
jgi:hypothetical protein